MSENIRSMSDYRMMQKIRSTEHILNKHFDMGPNVTFGSLLIKLYHGCKNGNGYAMECLETLYNGNAYSPDIILFGACERASETFHSLYDQICDGYVYIARNESFDGIYKIGYTTKNVSERLDTLSKATGVPTPFQEVFCMKMPDCRRFERLLHKKLDKFRVNKDREFFSCCLKKLFTIIGWEGRAYLVEMGIPLDFEFHVPWSETQMDIAVTLECKTEGCDCDSMEYGKIYE